MERLVWDETDVIGITEVIPEVEEYGTQHEFSFVRGGKKVCLKLWQLEGFAEILISDKSTGAHTAKVAFYCRGGCRVGSEDGVIIFHDSVFAENMFSYFSKGNIYEKDINPYGNDVRLFISKSNVFLDVV